MDNIEQVYLEEEVTSGGSGVANCLDSVKDSKSKSKIIRLLADGVDFGGLIPPDIAKEMANCTGLKFTQ